MSEDLRYSSVLAYVFGTPWAIMDSKLSEIMAFLKVKVAGDRIDPALVAEMRATAQSRPQRRQSGGVAVLPVFGTITHRAGLMSDMSGGTSIDRLTRDFRALVSDPDIGAIVLDVDSPGGSAAGVDELAAEIYRSRGTKPITAVANELMASAAYWIGSAADELVVTPSALVGSIGVISAHEDQSGLYEQLGVKVSLITAGKYKAENSPFEPITDEGRAEIQKHVDEMYGMFTRAVAKGRGVPVETVRAGFGEGRVVGAKEAISLGMADRMATIDEVVATIGQRQDAGQDTPAASYYVGAGDNRIVHQTITINGHPTAPLAQTFENESAAVLTAVQTFQARVEALTALRDGRKPLAQANVPRVAEHRDAYRALADAYDALVVACTADDNARLAAMRQARTRLHDLDLWLAEAG